MHACSCMAVQCLFGKAVHNVTETSKPHQPDMGPCRYYDKFLSRCMAQAALAEEPPLIGESYLQLHMKDNAASESSCTAQYECMPLLLHEDAFSRAP